MTLARNFSSYRPASSQLSRRLVQSDTGLYACCAMLLSLDSDCIRFFLCRNLFRRFFLYRLKNFLKWDCFESHQFLQDITSTKLNPIPKDSIRGLFLSWQNCEAFVFKTVVAQSGISEFPACRWSRIYIDFGVI